MSNLLRAFIAGCLTAAWGLVLLFGLGLTGVDPEESLGLNLLFKLRGIRAAPPDVVIVSLDKASADFFNLPAEPQKWPRSLYARLTEKLAQDGAAVIAFDILFNEPRLEMDDESFAGSIQSAGNVVLCECLKKDIISLPGVKGPQKSGVIHRETLEPPLPCLAKSALALAPFPLPKIPVTVSQYWTFKTAAGDTPTLPVVAYQVFNIDAYDPFISLLKEFNSVQVEILPPNKVAQLKVRNVEKTVRTVRDIFKQQPSIAAKILEKIALSPNRQTDGKKTQQLESLVRMYQSPDSQFLNFYGPPGTITTVSFYQILKNQTESGAFQKHFDFTGKAVFVGLSEQMRPEQKDGFYTVYSQSNGLDISGVEIAATAFANLLEDRPIRRFYVSSEAVVILVCGLVFGICSYVFPAGLSLAVLMLLSAAYLFFVRQQFLEAAIWWPIVIPLYFQVPAAFLGNLAWKYSEANKEGKRIKIALGYYLPDKVADQIAKNIIDIKANRENVEGTCLLTDAGRYTTLSDILEPRDLNNFMHKYYETLFKPVKNHGGTIINIVGDSILALWETKFQDAETKREACLAALDIIQAANRFNQSSGLLPLPIRIGMDSGRIVLGNVGALDHYEFRPTGPAVNTASRLEGLNKVLKTGILVSADVLNESNGLLIRGLGVFLLQGKTSPTAVCELICRREEATEQQKSLCEIFTEGLCAYRGQAWDQAIPCFRQCLQIFNQDGPAGYYLKKCMQHRAFPPEKEWDGLIKLEEK